MGTTLANGVVGPTPSEDMPCNRKAMFIPEFDYPLLSAMKNLLVLAVPNVDIIHSNCTDICFKLRTSYLICGKSPISSFLQHAKVFSRNSCSTILAFGVAGIYRTNRVV